jgi:K(+)-stimulated pyrophosphate-energized sodium pump
MTIALAFLAAVVALGFAVWLYASVRSAPATDLRALEISGAIAEGASAFLNRQYRTVGIVGLPIALVLLVVFGRWMAAGFVFGAVASAFAGVFGMRVSVQANVRVAEAARQGFRSAFDLAFKGGAVTGLMVVGAGLFVLALFVQMMLGSGFEALSHEKLQALIGLGFGGSLISVFARLGGGIFTKGADVGADLVGKVEANIPEDDPRNPAVIADNVGDNVGDCAGMAADLFETYLVTAVAAMLLSHLLFPESQAMFLYPLAIGAVAIFGSIGALFFVRIDEPAQGEQPAVMRAMYTGLGIATAVTLGLLLLVNVFTDIPEQTVAGQAIGGGRLWVCAALGGIVTAAMMWITDVYTGDGSRYVKKIADASVGGHATNIISGLAVGMQATVAPVVVIVAAMLACYGLAGLFGVAVAAMAMLSLAGHRGGDRRLRPDHRQRRRHRRDGRDGRRGAPRDGPARRLRQHHQGGHQGLRDRLGGPRRGGAVRHLHRGPAADRRHPGELRPGLGAGARGLFIGAMIPFLFASLAMEAVGKAGQKVVEEVRRQFREIPGLMEGTGKPDYRTCVDIVTQSALREMIAPALIPAVIPVVVGLVFGAQALGGLLIGSIVSGLCVALSMTTGGAAWDNAKKYIEAGAHGGKGSEAHKASVTGDTVGDPYKDTAGPAINPMLKLVNIVALIIIPFLT